MDFLRDSACGNIMNCIKNQEATAPQVKNEQHKYQPLLILDGVKKVTQNDMDFLGILERKAIASRVVLLISTPQKLVMDQILSHCHYISALTGSYKDYSWTKGELIKLIEKKNENPLGLVPSWKSRVNDGMTPFQAMKAMEDKRNESVSQKSTTLSGMYEPPVEVVQSFS